MPRLSWLIATLACATTALAAVPISITHTGYLLDVDDRPITQAGLVVGFSIWDDVASPDPARRVWPSTPNSCSVGVVAGYYSAVLGSACAPGLTAEALPWSTPRFLQVTIAGVALTPRIAITAVPTAGVAAVALGTPDGAITNAMLANADLSVTAGPGLTGGGVVALGGEATLGLATVGSAGSFTNANVTLDAYGRVTAASNGSPGGITSIIAGSGLTGGTITSAGTLAVDTGTGAGKIVALDGSARLPAVDGSLLTGVAATTFGGTLTSANVPLTLLGDRTIGGSLGLGGNLVLGFVAGACPPATAGTLRFDSSQQVVEVCTTSGWTPLSMGRVAATGGDLTTFTEGGYTYRVHTFRTVGNTNFVVTGAGSVEVLVVGGGGGGGSDLAGGGGAGGVRTSTSVLLNALTYVVTVGGGGAGGGQTRQSNSVGGDGSPSSFASIVAAGGGGGGSYWGGDAANQNGRTGGSAGGAGAGTTTTTGLGGAALATPAQGSAGGNAYGGSPYWGGGGGGAGGAGTHATSSAAGAGGPGVSSSISGSAVMYGGGGGGSGYGAGGGTTGGAGGSGGGGRGGYGISVAGGISTGVAGTANTGGGGGGGSWTGSTPTLGGAGGSGIVIIRYRTN